MDESLNVGCPLRRCVTSGEEVPSAGVRSQGGTYLQAISSQHCQQLRGMRAFVFQEESGPCDASASAAARPLPHADLLASRKFTV